MPVDHLSPWCMAEGVVSMIQRIAWFRVSYSHTSLLSVLWCTAEGVVSMVQRIAWFRVLYSHAS